ncbi:MAG: dinitrogenase iron-molybdenum cofactor biosynthesis protein [Spirochaetaceae bacterium]|jgi:predicted Fe-Mo cluster-binding NifX family protein|nr:dinitrogenase iron-molybdenum cofactor biosynthesis protein [Spirochaetaceae bacterium]
MPWRVAVSSLDGVLINEHFGRARWFYIIDAEKDGPVVTVEQRMVTPLCQCGSHSEQGMSAGIEALGDCLAVLTAKIGPAARKQLEGAGLSVFEEPAVVEEAVKKLAAYYKKTKRPENI